MPVKIEVNEELYDKIRELYWGNGYTQKEVAQEFGVTESAVSRWMQRGRIQTRTDVRLDISPEARKSSDVVAVEKRFGQDIRTILFALYWTDAPSQTTVAENLNLDASTVSRWMYQFNVPTRDTVTGKDIIEIAEIIRKRVRR